MPTIFFLVYCSSQKHLFDKIKATNKFYQIFSQVGVVQNSHSEKLLHFIVLISEIQLSEKLLIFELTTM